MKDSLLNGMIIIFLCLFLIFPPHESQAGAIELSQIEIDLGENVETSKQMTQKQMNDLFGEDPYLGQTSYLQSPEGFNLREKSKN